MRTPTSTVRHETSHAAGRHSVTSTPGSASGTTLTTVTPSSNTPTYSSVRSSAVRLGSEPSNTARNVVAPLVRSNGRAGHGPRRWGGESRGSRSGTPLRSRLRRCSSGTWPFVRLPVRPRPFGPVVGSDSKSTVVPSNVALLAVEAGRLDGEDEPLLLVQFEIVAHGGGEPRRGVSTRTGPANRLVYHPLGTTARSLPPPGTTPWERRKNI